MPSVHNLLLMRALVPGAWATVVRFGDSCQLLNGVSEPVLLRTFEYLRNVDNALGDRVERGVRAG